MTEMTRTAARARATAFQPRMGRAYAATRNTDAGAGTRGNVSVLSPFIRRRLLSEAELVQLALSAHGPAASEKFVQEVIWRSYFKGWLEHRPGVWDSYRKGLSADLARLQSDPDLAKRHTAALSGHSGFACVDAWAAELRETGYLHNHARMWFASIWIFTLRLPWRLGATFFLEHLLDGDAASNTLSWRWVAGLHTPGKNYAARSDNIARYTEGRFPQTPGLAQNPAPLSGDDNPARTPLRTPQQPDPSRPTLLLVTEEDGQPETWATGDIKGIATLHLSRMRTPLGASKAVIRAETQALADAAQRFGATPVMLDHPEPAALADAARRVGATQITTAYLPIGWVHDWITTARPTLEGAGITLAEVQNDWDRAFWPHATAGFFKLKKQIPGTLRALGIAPTPDAGDLPLFSHNG